MLVPKFKLREQIDFVVVLRVPAVLMRLPVLTHHDDRGLQRGESREHEIQKNERVGVERMTGEQPGIDQHPDHQDGAEQPDERPAAAELRDAIGYAHAECHLRHEVPMNELTPPAAPRNLQNSTMLVIDDL